MTVKRATLIIALGVCAAVVLPILIFTLAIVWPGNNLSPEKAQVICHQLASDAEKTVSSISEFRAIDSSESCQVQTDELNSKDYIAGVHFLLTKPGASTQPLAVTSSDTDLLRKRLTPVQEAWMIRNIIDADGQSYMICVSTSAYIDNDGSFYSQGNDNNIANYFGSKSDTGYSDRCLK